MKPSRSAPSYSAPGIFSVQFGVTRVKESQRSLRQTLAARGLLQHDVLTSLGEVVAGRQPSLSTTGDHGVDAFHASVSFALIDETSRVLCTSTCIVRQREKTDMPRMGYAGGEFFRDRGGQIGMMAITRRCFLALIEHVQVSGSEGGFSATADTQFAVDAAGVLLYRLWGDTEGFGDLAIGKTRRDQFQNIMLANTQRFWQRPSLAPAGAGSAPQAASRRAT